MKRNVLVATTILIFVLLGIGFGIVSINTSKLKFNFPKTISSSSSIFRENTKVVSEESITIDIVKKVTPAVVTVGITKNQPIFDYGNGFDPFGGGFFQMPQQRGTKQVKQDIGSGFIVRSSGLIITNKHVVSDIQAKYRVITSDNKSFDVQKIYRDPSNDLAILKIDPPAGGVDLPTMELGDSDKLQVGQFAIAIGTALGEFRSTVTTGVVSGLQRGITAGGPFSGSEKLDDVIQTSAPINPGNSGGPLLNSSGQVIGVNVAVAQDGQNIGFALPINLVKESLKTFETNGGEFAKRAYLGVEYRMITRELAVLNEIPEGAYVQTVVEDSPAAKAGIEQGDIITKIDGKNVRETDGGLAKIISGKKPGDTLEITLYRGESETKIVKVTLGEGSP